MTTEDGGPAFPRAAAVASESEIVDGVGHAEQDGMSLRDWFAGQALTGLVNLTHAEKLKPSGPDEAAHWAYMLADAMLAARESRP